MRGLIKLTFFILFCFFSLQNQAQNRVGVYLGEEYKIAYSNSYLTEIIPAVQGEFYAIREKPGGGLLNTQPPVTYLEKYNNELQQVFTGELKLPAIHDKRAVLEKLVYLNDSLYAFFSGYNKEKDITELYAGIIEKNQLKGGEAYKICDIGRDQVSDGALFNIILSPDSSHILVSAHPNIRSNASKEFLITVLNTDFNILYQKNMTLPYRDGNYNIGDILIDKENNAFFLAQFQPERSGLFSSTPDPVYELTGYFHSSDKVQRYEVTSGTDIVSRVKLSLDTGGAVILSGFYSEEAPDMMKGYFISGIRDTTLAGIAKHEFTDVFLKQFLNDRQVRKGHELSHYQIRQVINREDGGLMLVAEYENQVRHSYMTAGGYLRSSFSYYFDNIIIINVAPDGSTDWYAKIPKKQLVTDVELYELSPFRSDLVYGLYNNDSHDGEMAYMGFSSMVSGSKIFLIFNDHRKNSGDRYDPDNLKTMSNPRRAVTNMMIVDVDGSIHREKLFPARTDKAILMPMLHKQKGNQLIMYGERGRYFRFYKIQTDE